MMYNYELHRLFKDPDTAVMMKVARMRWLGHVIRTDEAVIIR
jgi:hypothetical protein